MTTYLATIRIEAFGLAEANQIAAEMAIKRDGMVVQVAQEREPYVRLEPDEEFKPLDPKHRRRSTEILREVETILLDGHEDHPLPSEPSPHEIFRGSVTEIVTEAIEAAKAELRAEMAEMIRTVEVELDPALIARAMGPIPKPQLLPNHNFESGGGWEYGEVKPLDPVYQQRARRLWQQVRKWWKR